MQSNGDSGADHSASQNNQELFNHQQESNNQGINYWGSPQAEIKECYYSWVEFVTLSIAFLPTSMLKLTVKT